MTCDMQLFDEQLQRLKDHLKSLLNKWASGQLDERTVHDEADRLWFARKEWPQFGNSDPRSITIEVLEQLSMLNWQWITREDIPAMLAFLDSPPGQEQESWKRWEEYWEMLDWAERRRSLANNAYYSKTGPHSKEPD